MRQSHKLAALAVFASLVVAGLSRGDEYNKDGIVVQGTGVQTAAPVGAAGLAKFTVQCPNIDGGAGQLVYYRPGGCTGCVVDAGPGDYLIDFRTNGDGYPVTLRQGMNRLHLRAYVETHAVYCSVFSKSP